MERVRTFYFERNHTLSKELNRLKDLFNDRGPWVHWFKQDLVDPTSRGVDGEFTCVDIKNNTVKLTPTDLSGDEPEDFIELDRCLLLRLANDWERLVDAKAPYIFIYQKEGELFVSDTLPEGME